MTDTTRAARVASARLRVPSWIVAAIVAAAAATGATVLIENSSSGSGGAAAHGNGLASQPTVCVQQAGSEGPGHC
jgi:hypothetical protein